MDTDALIHELHALRDRAEDAHFPAAQAIDMGRQIQKEHAELLVRTDLNRRPIKLEPFTSTKG